jgi:hypothetical protein
MDDDTCCLLQSNRQLQYIGCSRPATADAHCCWLHVFYLKEEELIRAQQQQSQSTGLLYNDT